MSWSSCCCTKMPLIFCCLNISHRIPLPSMRNSCPSSCSSGRGEECCETSGKHQSNKLGAGDGWVGVQDSRAHTKITGLEEITKCCPADTSQLPRGDVWNELPEGAGCGEGRECSWRHRVKENLPLFTLEAAASKSQLREQQHNGGCWGK